MSPTRVTRNGAILPAAALCLSACLSGCMWGGHAPHRGAAPRPGATQPALAAPAGPAGPAGTAATPAPSWVARENAKPGTISWKILAADVAGDAELSGFADSVSARPGDRVTLRVTTTAPAFTVRAFRLGWYGGAGAREVWRSRRVPGMRQPASTLVRATRTVTTAWRPSLALSTAGWPEGTYLLKLTASTGKERYVPLTVRSASSRGRVVLMSSTATYEAYNTWGGYSLYGGPDRTGGTTSFGTRSYVVSYDRPYDGNGAKQLVLFELSVVQEAERSGVDLAYLTDSDLARDTHALDGARGYVSMGHDEYWTAARRAQVATARDHGTNVAFLGANAVYWRIRFAAGPSGADRLVVGYKSAALDPLTRTDPRDVTVKFRQAPDANPENSLTGMLYECFPARGSFTVVNPSFFLFARTGAHRGSAFRGLAGPEADRAYPVAGTPADLDVVADSPISCRGRADRSTATYYSTRSGAGVFDVGTMLWARALHGPDRTYGVDAAGAAFARTVTANLLAAMAAGPMGRLHPAHGNLAALHDLTAAHTGTG